jgi:glycerol-3-phosphate dehydrogenase
MYDVCIIGGGINGVTAALQCSEAGYSTILFEQKRLANGASSKTSKLAHGGLRYLANLELSLVKESLQERNILLEKYPSLVKPQPFIFPIYKGESSLKMWAGLKMYDLLSSKSSLPKSGKISIEHAKLKLPWLSTDNLKSCFMYYDAVMNDKEIVHTIANEARQKGVEIYSNEPVVRLDRSDNDVSVITTKSNINARIVINATGAWSNKLAQKQLVNPTKGVHLVTNKLLSKAATILINPDDKRVFFTIPYNNNTVIGTTDTPYSGDPDNIKITRKDVNYILDAVNEFSIDKLEKDDIINSWVGLRPLAVSNTEDVDKISRDYTIDYDRRMLSIVGGKFTTHRSMIETLMGEIKKYV